MKSAGIKGVSVGMERLGRGLVVEWSVLGGGAGEKVEWERGGNE